MSRQLPRTCLTISFLLLLCLFNLGTLSTARAHNTSLDHPWKLLETHRHNLLAISSDNEALKFSQTFIPHQQQPRHSHTRRTSPKTTQASHPIPQEIQTSITTFLAAMTTIEYVQKFRTALESVVTNHLLAEIFPSDSQLQWIFSKSSLEGFKDFVTFQKTLSTWLKQEPREGIPENGFFQFSKFDDHITLNTDRQMWIRLFTDLGVQGIQSKLEHYWQQYDPQDVQPTLSDSRKQTLIQHYVESRLFPIFRAHLLTQALQIEVQAYNVVRNTWQHIQQWQQQEQTNHAMMRLCGTWKWIIHNHQNHGDHKTTMTFSPPNQSTPSQVQPSSILIHGDTVYLKWTFPQGIQEDSLLLSNRDSRLEGTFTNSLGPYGSISGNRLSPCQN